MSENNKNSYNFKKEKKKSSHNNHKLFMTVGGIIIFVMATVAFILAPTFVGSSSGSDIPPLGVYNGHKIEYKQNSYFANMVSQIGTQYKDNGQEIDTQTHFSIFNQAFNSTALYYEAKDRIEEANYIVTETEINRNMVPYFYDTNGNYSAKIFNDTPDSNKVEIRNNIETNLLYNRYITDLFGTNMYDSQNSQFGLKTSTNEASFIANMGSKERSFKMASFNTADYPKEEAEKYGNANVDKFTKYNLSILTLESQEDADSVLSQLNDGTLQFADAITQYSKNNYSSDDGILTNNYAYQLDSLITSETADDDIAFVKNLADGNFSGVIKTGQSYSIFKGNGAPVEPDMSDSLVATDVLNYMKSYERGEIEDYFVNKAKDFSAIALSNTLDVAAKEVGATITEIPAFPLNYANNELLAYVPSSDIPELANAETNENFLETAYALSDDEISEPIVLGDYVLLLQLDEEITEDTDSESFGIMFPYYTSQFDQNALTSYVVTSDKLQNDLFSVYLQYFMSDN